MMRKKIALFDEKSGAKASLIFIVFFCRKGGI
jgi:hypothetical protein